MSMWGAFGKYVTKLATGDVEGALGELTSEARTVASRPRAEPQAEAEAAPRAEARPGAGCGHRVKGFACAGHTPEGACVMRPEDSPR